MFDDVRLDTGGTTIAQETAVELYEGLQLNERVRLLRPLAKGGMADLWVAEHTVLGVGWQHWFSPQVELRPELVYYHSLDANAFNGNVNACPASANCAVSVIPPNRNFALIASMDLIWHF